METWLQGRALYRELGSRTFPEHVERRLGLAPRDVRQLLELQRRLPFLPELEGAWRRGELAPRQLAHLLEVVEPETEADWLDEEEAPPKKRGFKKWLLLGCGCGCLVMVLAGVTVGVLFMRAADPERQWPRIEALLPFDERPDLQLDLLATDRPGAGAADRAAPARAGARYRQSGTGAGGGLLTRPTCGPAPA